MGETLAKKAQNDNKMDVADDDDNSENSDNSETYLDY